MTSLTGPATALLRDVYELPEPVVSVYFGMGDPADDDVTLRRRAIRHRLLRAATSSAVLEAVERALSEVPRGPGMLAAFVGRDGSERLFEMPGADLADRVGRAVLPDVVPFLRWRQYRPPYVFAILGRDGAEVAVRRSPETQAVTATVSRPGDNRAGDPRLLGAAGSPRAVAASRAARSVTEALSASGARLLILAGDLQAVRYFRDHLPDWVREEVRVAPLPGGRSPQGSAGRQDENLDRTVRSMVDTRLREAVATVVGQSGPGGPGVQGLPEVIDALAHGHMRELLIGQDTDAMAWFGPDPTDISEQRSQLTAAEAERRTGPVTDVLIRAATLTDTGVGILPVGLSENLRQQVGGIRRLAD